MAQHSCANQRSSVSDGTPGLPQLLESRDWPHGRRITGSSARLRLLQDTPWSPGGRLWVLQRPHWIPPALIRRSRDMPGARAGALALRDSAHARRRPALHHRAGSSARQGIRFS